MSLDTSGFIQTVNATLVSGSTAPTATSAPILTVESPAGTDSLPFAELRMNVINVDPVASSRWLMDGDGGNGAFDTADAAFQYRLESTSVEDQPGGNGAREFTVEGIDGNGAVTTVTVAGCPNGAGPYNSDPFSGLVYIHKITVTDFGSNGRNVGDVAVRNNALSVTYATMEALTGYLTSGASFMVPLGKNLKLKNLQLGFDSGPNPIADVSLYMTLIERFTGGVLNANGQERRIFRQKMLGSGVYSTNGIEFPEIGPGQLMFFQMDFDDPASVTTVQGAMTFVLYDE